MLAAHGVAAVAQTTVYESKDKVGPVYTDKPVPGAMPSDLPPANVIETAKPAAPMRPSAQASAPAYRSLAVASPTNEDTVHTNTGAFDFTASSVPSLRAMHRIRVKLDGRLLPTSFGSTSLNVSEADWQMAASAESATHSLQLAIVDAQGAVLIESAPVNFYLRRATR